MRLGLFGGTFDPPHIGHLMVAQDAWAALALDRVVFIPASSPPHKRGRVSAPAKLRLEMLRAAIGDDPRFDVDEIELHRPGPSYTVDTLRELRRRDARSEFFLLLGADQYREMYTWREPHEIASFATVAVLTRAGAGAAGGAEPVDCQCIEVTRIDLSATDIRKRVATGLPIRYLVPAGVAAVIRREWLYEKAARR